MSIKKDSKGAGTKSPNPLISVIESVDLCFEREVSLIVHGLRYDKIR